MASFNEYNRDPQRFSFLDDLKSAWKATRTESSTFIAHGSVSEHTTAEQMMGRQSKTIKPKGTKKYSAFGILFQGHLIDDYIRTYT